MPARNAESSIALAVRSTLLAMPRDAELVVHDDASTDGTRRIMERIRDPRLRIIQSETVQGVAGGLNLLLQAVDAEVIARMDADDACLPWRFAAQERALRTGVDLVFCTVVYFGPPRTRIRPMPPVSISPAAFPLHLLLANPVSHSTMYGRLECISAVGGYRAIPAEDYDLWLRMCAQGARLTRLAVPGVCYRVHPKQITKSTHWRAMASADQEIVTVYDALGTLKLNVQPDWYAELRAARRGILTPGSAAALERMSQAVARASKGLTRRERWFLKSKSAKIVRGKG